MSYDFSQRRLFDKKNFRFTNDGLCIRSSNAGKVHEYEIKYENIGTKIIFWKNGLTIYLLIAAFLIGICTLFYFDTSGPGMEPGMKLFISVLIAICIALYFITYKKARYLTDANNSNPIELFTDKPDTEAVDHFIKEILSRRKAYLLERFGQLNKNISYEPQYNNLNWLLYIDAISKAEYDQMLMELNALYPSTPVVKGFSINNDLKA